MSIEQFVLYLPRDGHMRHICARIQFLSRHKLGLLLIDKARTDKMVHRFLGLLTRRRNIGAVSPTGRRRDIIGVIHVKRDGIFSADKSAVYLGGRKLHRRIMRKDVVRLAANLRTINLG